MSQNKMCKYHPICDVTIYLPPKACESQEFVAQCPRYSQYLIEFDGKEPLGELERMFREGEVIGGEDERD